MEWLVDTLLTLMMMWPVSDFPGLLQPKREAIFLAKTAWKWKIFVMPPSSWIRHWWPVATVAEETRMHSSRMHTVCSSSRLLEGMPQWMLGYTTSPWAWPWTLPDVGLDTPLPNPPTSPLGVGLDTHPNEQNDRHVQKHHLRKLRLRAVNIISKAILSYSM